MSFVLFFSKFTLLTKGMTLNLVDHNSARVHNSGSVTLYINPFSISTMRLWSVSVIYLQVVSSWYTDEYVCCHARQLREQDGTAKCVNSKVAVPRIYNRVYIY